MIVWKGERMTTTVRTGAVGVGYEGRTIDGFVAELKQQGVRRLVDVRLTPLSRKRGFSKSALMQALATSGIAYEHRAVLGNPRENRAGFAGSDDDRGRARAVFAARLREPESIQAIEALAAAANRERIAILCFEADQLRCHRDVVLAEIARRGCHLTG
jgi:uncharacterized protein (DUF488 family)